MGDSFAITVSLLTLNLVNSNNILIIFIALITAFFLLGFLLGLCLSCCHKAPPYEKHPEPSGTIKASKPANTLPSSSREKADEQINTPNHKHKHSRHSHHRHHNVHSL